MAISENNSIPWAAYLKDNTGLLQELGGISLGTTKLELYTSVEEMYSTVDWVFKASSDLIDNFVITNISIGSEIFFEFSQQNTPDGKTINRSFKVLSITNGMGLGASTLGTTYNLVLISPWYFDQFLASKAYYGTVSQIVTEMFTDDLVNVQGTRIEESQDTPAIRYRTFMKQGDFIQQRLRKYLIGSKNTSSYVFTNTDDYFEVTSYSTMGKQNIYLAIDLSNTHIAAFQDMINDPVSSQYVIYPHSVLLEINNDPSRNLWDVALPALSYPYKYPRYVKTYKDNPVIQVLGYDNSNRFSFINLTKNSNYTKIYLLDSLRHESDLFAESLNEYLQDLRHAHKITLVCHPNMNILVGRQCYYYINQSDGSPSVFAQSYIIKEVTHILEGLQARTEITMEITSFDYTTVPDVSTLFSLSSTVT